MIEFECSHCGHAIRVKDEAAGRRGQCNACGETIKVPTLPIRELRSIPRQPAPDDATVDPAPFLQTGPPIAALRKRRVPIVKLAIGGLSLVVVGGTLWMLLKGPVGPTRPAGQGTLEAGQAGDFKDAGLEARTDDVTVVVTGVTVGTVFMVVGGDNQPHPVPDIEPLQVRIKVTNRSETRKIDYNSWSSIFGREGDAVLRDEFENIYHHMPISLGAYIAEGAYLVGEARSGSLYPGESTEDLILFEKPVPAAKTLQMTLPAAYGGTGPLRFKFPVPAQQTP